MEIGIRQAKDRLSEYLNRVAYGGERIVILSRGRPKAALISMEDLRRLEELEAKMEAAMLEKAVATETEFYSAAEVEAELAALEAEGK